MAFEAKDNEGSLFKNDKATHEKSPQAKGSALIDGVAFWVSAWTNIDKNGNRYQKLKFERKEQTQAQPRQQSYTEARGGREELSDEIPF